MFEKFEICPECQGPQMYWGYDAQACCKCGYGTVDRRKQKAAAVNFCAGYPASALEQTTLREVVEVLGLLASYIGKPTDGFDTGPISDDDGVSVSTIVRVGDIRKAHAILTKLETRDDG